jgi:phosphatidylserine decarboxylase
MLETLLFKESPYLSLVIIFIALLLRYKSYNSGFFILLSLLILLMIFYRYEPYKLRFNDNIIISPAEGLITNIHQSGNNIHISIFLSIFNKHTQIYPVNGKVINRIYDRTGKYDLVINIDKSKYNEKKIHIIKMKNGNTLNVTQIAGFFPRSINSSNKIPEEIKSGEYMGIIKFGSRVDLLFPGDISNLKIKEKQTINIGDIIYEY